jgi:hypothetical protein
MSGSHLGAARRDPRPTAGAGPHRRCAQRRALANDPGSRRRVAHAGHRPAIAAAAELALDQRGPACELRHQLVQLLDEVDDATNAATPAGAAPRPSR